MPQVEIGEDSQPMDHQLEAAPLLQRTALAATR